MSASENDRLRVEVDEDLEDLIPGFLERRGEEVEQMRAALAAGDFAAIRAQAHRLKGVGASYGFSGISALGLALEQAAKAGDQAALANSLDQLASYLVRVEVVFVPSR